MNDNPLADFSIFLENTEQNGTVRYRIYLSPGTKLSL